MTCVSMGNPHAVTFGRPGAETLGGTLDVDNLDVDYYGPLFEKHETFLEKINAHFCKAIYDDPTSLNDLTDAVKVVHWERGAGKSQILSHPSLSRILSDPILSYPILFDPIRSLPRGMTI